MSPPPTPIVNTSIDPNKLAQLVREGRELGLIDGSEYAVYLADQLFPNDSTKAMQFLNLCDPLAHRAIEEECRNHVCGMNCCHNCCDYLNQLGA